MTTPLSAGGVGMYIDETLNYRVIEKNSNEAFQALWLEIDLGNKANAICGVLYRQHNSPDSFQKYFDTCLEKFSASGKPIYILGDFNINLLRFETGNYAHNFLLTAQSYGFVSVIDKPTRVRNDSATLIDNILLNDVSDSIVSGNIVSDISDHYSQFCLIPAHKRMQTGRSKNKKFRDFLRLTCDGDHDVMQCCVYAHALSCTEHMSRKRIWSLKWQTKTKKKKLAIYRSWPWISNCWLWDSNSGLSGIEPRALTTPPRRLGANLRRDATSRLLFLDQSVLADFDPRKKNLHFKTRSLSATSNKP